MTKIPFADLWHRAGRAARDNRKRLLALYGVLLTPPVLVLGAFVYGLSRGEIPASESLRPLSYVADPFFAAWRADEDLALLSYVFLQGLLLSALWGWIGGAVARLAAVHLATGRREEGPAALAFATRHWRSFAGASAALLASFVVPTALAILLSTAGRLPGAWGGFLLAPAVLVAAALALAAVVAASVCLAAGFLAQPTVACEDSDAFDAVSRVFVYAAAGMPRVVVVRLAFFLGAVLGSGWRLLRTAGTLVVAAIAVRAGAGEAAYDRASAILSAFGEPPDAARLGIRAGDYAVAVAAALVAGGCLALWLADLVSRAICARVGAYLALRQAVDRVPADELRTPSAASPRLDAEAAGFVEVARVPSGPDES